MEFSFSIKPSFLSLLVFCSLHRYAWRFPRLARRGSRRRPVTTTVASIHKYVCTYIRLSIYIYLGRATRAASWGSKREAEGKKKVKHCRFYCSAFGLLFFFWGFAFSLVPFCFSFLGAGEGVSSIVRQLPR